MTKDFLLPVVVQSLSHVRLTVTPWTAARPPTPLSRDCGVHEYLTWEAAYLSLNRENRSLL